MPAGPLVVIAGVYFCCRVYCKFDIKETFEQKSNCSISATISTYELKQREIGRFHCPKIIKGETEESNQKEAYLIEK